MNEAKIVLDGADPRSEKEIRDTLTSLEAEWPGIAPSSLTLTNVWSDDNGHMSYDAHTMGQTNVANGDMRLSLRCAADYDLWHHDVLQGIRTRALHKGISRKPAAYTVTHEFGHLVTVAATGHPPTDPRCEQPLRELTLVAWHALDPSVDLTRTDMVPFVWNLGFYRDGLVKDVSGYGASNPMELFAEAFAINRIAGPGHSKVADAVTAELNKRVRGKVAA